MRYHIILSIFFIFSFTSLLSQDEYAAADSRARLTKAGNISDLHSSLIKGLETDEQKARAFYSWIADNIAYDIHEARSSFPDINTQSVDAVLRSRKAVCHGYSVLFSELCRRSGIKSYLVSGYHKQDGIFDATGHTWNIVFINNKWQPVDATWSAGGVTGNKFIKDFNDEYFLTAPEKFLEDHYPFDPMWQLVSNPVKLEPYRKGKVMVQAGGAFMFNDTIAKWEQADSLEAELISAERAVRFNPSDKLAARQLGYTKVNMGNREFAKGNKLIEEVFGKKDAPSGHANRSSLDSIEYYFLKAEMFYKNADTGSAFDNQVIKKNMDALQANLKIIRSEKERLKRRKP